MRLTREALLRYASEAAAQRARAHRDVVCIYLIGSLLRDRPLLGGTTDIDLVVVHIGDPPVEREVVRVTQDVTLDILHHPQSLYQQPRNLRQHPWLGPALYHNPIVLHDTQHWFEFAQSGVTAQYNRPDFVMARARQLAEKARGLWLAMENGDSPYSDPISPYLETLEAAANAVAMLSGPPLSERRLLMDFPERATAVGRPGMAAGLVDLLGGEQADAETLRTWLGEWEKALRAAGGLADGPVRLSAARLPYYRRAVEAMLDGGHSQDALWPLLVTWLAAAGRLRAGDPSQEAWMETRRTLELDADSLVGRLSALDAYLDSLEETLEDWAAENGA